MAGGFVGMDEVAAGGAVERALGGPIRSEGGGLILGS